MRILLAQLHPDAPTGGGEGSSSKPNKPSQPSADDDLATTAKKASEMWLLNPAITLVWKTAAEFKTLKNNYVLVLSERKSAGSVRPNQTQTLLDIIGDINEGASKVKKYIDKKAKTQREAYSIYPKFGFVHYKNKYTLPTDRDMLPDALELMKSSIVSEGFGDEDFGTTFWTDITSKFNTAFKDANDTDGSVSGKVGTKNQLKKEIKKVLKALRAILVANYPETYKSVLREWGWQKEDFK